MRAKFQIAFETIQAEDPDLIILDFRFEHPESGWNLLQLIRLNPSTRNIPVIVMSVDTRFLREKEAELEKIGCCVLPKLFDIDSFLATIQKALNPTTK